MMASQAAHHDDSVIFAAGGIIRRRTANGDEVLLVRRKRYGDWTFPKGKLKRGESFLKAAVREVEEETGCAVSATAFLGAVGYEVKGVPKVVLYWSMSIIKQCALEEQDEVAEVRWFQVPEAMRTLTYEREKDLLARLG